MVNKRKSGFTLLELMIGAAVLVIALSGLLSIFANLISLNENARNLTLGMTACQDKLEEIRKADFSTAYTVFNNTHFNPAGFNPVEAEGTVYVNNANPALLNICVTVSWRTRSNRVFGEDKNLNGILDAGEDADGNDRLSSPAEIITLMAQR